MKQKQILKLLIVSLLFVRFSYADEIILIPGKPVDSEKIYQMEKKTEQQALLKALRKEEEQLALIKRKQQELIYQAKLLENLKRESQGLTGKRKLIIDFAKAQLGKQYTWGTTGPNTFDCSGLIFRAYQSAGLSIPRHSLHQKNYGKEISFNQALPGDLIYVRGHIGIYAGNETIIEASGSGSTGKVKLTPLSNKWWQKRNPVFVRIIK